MHQVGFRDPSHFARDFRRYHGIAPSVVRGATHHPGPVHPPLERAITADTGLADDSGPLSEIQDPLKRRSRE
jgi:AraC-like DNA-binding protein